MIGKFSKEAVKNAFFFTHIDLLAFNAGRVILGFAKDVLLEQIGVLSGCTNEAHVLELGDSAIEILRYLFIKSLCRQILVKVAFRVNDFERFVQGYQIYISPLVHHELHQNRDVLPGALDRRLTFLLIDTLGSDLTNIALVLLFLLLALLFDSLDVVKN